MADKNLLAQMLENLVNDNQDKAEELFHEYVVSASREIYEELIESEITDEEVDEASEETDEAVEEDADLDEDQTDEDLEENFEDIAYEGGDDMPADGTDDLEGDLDMGDEMGSEDGERSEEELFQDLDSIVDELQAKFDELKGVEGEEHGDSDFGGDMEGPEEEGFEPQLATVREYVEKVTAGHGAEKKGGAEGQLSGTGTQSDKPSVNTKSIVAGKNDMGGTASNIAQAQEDSGSVYAAQGQLKGTGLAKGTTQEENFGNVNVPGGNAGKTGFKKKEPGHGAEKKGQGEGPMAGTGNHTNKEGGHNTQSLFRGRR
jgi:hypothetical protein